MELILHTFPAMMCLALLTVVLPMEEACIIVVCQKREDSSSAFLKHPLHSTKNITLNIVDMNITGPNLIWPGDIAVAGENVELSVHVTTFPEDVRVPY